MTSYGVMACELGDLSSVVADQDKIPPIKVYTNSGWLVYMYYLYYDT